MSRSTGSILVELKNSFYWSLGISQNHKRNQIIVGELRWRAAKIANLKEIPCIRKTGLTPTLKLEEQLIENIHHHKLDLGECIDELKLLLSLGTQTLKCNRGLKNLLIEIIQHNLKLKPFK